MVITQRRKIYCEYIYVEQILLEYGAIHTIELSATGNPLVLEYIKFT
jgi:hypothetical protein